MYPAGALVLPSQVPASPDWFQPVGHTFSTRLHTGKQVLQCTLPWPLRSPGSCRVRLFSIPNWALSQLSTPTHYISLIWRVEVYSVANIASVPAPRGSAHLNLQGEITDQETAQPRLHFVHLAGYPRSSRAHR